MGLIADRLRGDETRAASNWLADDTPEYGRSTTAGVRVTQSSALGLATVWRCVDILAGAISCAPKDVVIKIGGQSFPEYSNLPAWIAAPDPGDPGLTIDDHFNQVALSLLLDGNFFTLAEPYVFDAEMVIVQDPRRVRVRKGDRPLYDLLDERGHVTQTVGPEKMLHGTWLRLPGSLRGISPLEALRQGIGGAIATQEHANRFFGQGATLSFGVEVPGALDKEQKDELRENLKKRHEGLSNTHAIGILTGGAKFVPNLAPTPEQAQFLETRQFQREDLCNIYGVPVQLLNGQQAGASSYASAYVHEDEFRKYGVLPLAERIEGQYDRLVSVPGSINAPNATAQFKFNLDNVARIDLGTRYTAYKDGIQGGFLTPDEARRKEDLPPLPNGVGGLAYMQQQMVPVGTPPQQPAAPAAQREAA